MIGNAEQEITQLNVHTQTSSWYTSAIFIVRRLDFPFVVFGEKLFGGELFHAC